MTTKFAALAQVLARYIAATNATARNETDETITNAQEAHIDLANALAAFAGDTPEAVRNRMENLYRGGWEVVGVALDGIKFKVENK